MFVFAVCTCVCVCCEYVHVFVSAVSLYSGISTIQHPLQSDLVLRQREFVIVYIVKPS